MPFTRVTLVNSNNPNPAAAVLHLASATGEIWVGITARPHSQPSQPGSNSLCGTLFQPSMVTDGLNVFHPQADLGGQSGDDIDTVTVDAHNKTISAQIQGPNPRVDTQPLV